MIRIDSVSLRLGNVDVLHDITIGIPKGGVSALVGPNGAGKSTLLSLIARLRSLQSGRIQVDDLEVGACSNDVLARKLSILPQASDVAPRLTVRELIGFGRYPHNRGRPTRADHDKVSEAIGAFDLHDLSERPLDTLSGGQRQRAQVAMIYAQDTEYILLDEPLNNLDIAASRFLMRLLRRLAKGEGRTIIVVLHDINYACGYADHLVALKNGCVVAEGVPFDVVDNAFMERVFETDARVHAADGRPVVWV